MLSIAIAVVAGAGLSFGLWSVMAPVFSHPTLARTNVHGRPVPTAGGVVLVLVVPVWLAILTLDTAFGADVLPSGSHHGMLAALTAVLGFGVLGLIDDLLGDGSSRGFRGHLGAMRRGELTTGAIKLVGGGVVALIVVSQSRSYEGRPGWLLIDAALVALAANLANLLDRAPGRVTKVATISALVLVLVAPTEALVDDVSDPNFWRHPPVATMLVIGAALGVMVPELRERMMLGDAGANVVGAALGLGVVSAVGTTARLVVLGALVVLNLASERISFSRVITATPGLRQFDQWGRARE